MIINIQIIDNHKLTENINVHTATNNLKLTVNFNVHAATNNHKLTVNINVHIVNDNLKLTANCFYDYQNSIFCSSLELKNTETIQHHLKLCTYHLNCS